MTKDMNAGALRSMTGFANLDGRFEDWTWSCDVRAVNGKGLDLRVRGPDWIDGLEVQVRQILSGKFRRGNISLNIKVARDETAARLTLQQGQLTAVLVALKEIETQALDAGLDLAPSRAADIAMVRGVLDADQSEAGDTSELCKALVADVGTLADELDAMRQKEGAALFDVLQGHLRDIEQLVTDAGAVADARKDDIAANLKRNLQQVMDGVSGADPDRVAQEIALIVVKSDVTEELDRLRAHVAAARDLLVAGGSVGRKLDFLMQEFNREANTLCAKAQNSDLTRIGLDLKTVIDRMREQVQNVE